MSIFGTDGVRGRAGEGLLGAGEVERLGAAFATALGADAVIAVARDTRISGPWIRDSLLDGLTAVGADVVDLGVLPTPALSRALAAEAAWSGGVMITASHNPFHDNGLKFFGPDGLKATDDLQRGRGAVRGADPGVRPPRFGGLEPRRPGPRHRRGAAPAASPRWGILSPR